MEYAMKRSTLYIFGALLLTLAGGCSVQKKCPAPELNLSLIHI